MTYFANAGQILVNFIFGALIALPAADFVFDAAYPDTQQPRDARFVIVEVLWSVGRSVKVKKQLLAQLHRNLTEGGFDPEQLMLVFKEVAWENWSFAGTRTHHA